LQEKTLVRVLAATGLVSLAIIVVSSYLMQDKIRSAVIPFIFCMSDESGANPLGQPLSESSCVYVARIAQYSDAALCDSFDGAKKDACLGLASAAKTRISECASFLSDGVNQTVVSQADITRYCDALISS
jgi:hypothetical protein